MDRAGRTQARVGSGSAFFNGFRSERSAFSVTGRAGGRENGLSSGLTEGATVTTPLSKDHVGEIDEDDQLLRALFWGCCNGGSGTEGATFEGTYSSLLSFALPRNLSKQLVRDIFDSSLVDPGATTLDFYAWRNTMTLIAKKMFALDTDSVALSQLAAYVRFVKELCDDGVAFVHALNCVGLLTISFCYWDAYWLHQKYAGRGLRGLLHALKEADVLRVFERDDLPDLVQRLRFVDKRRKTRHDKAMLEQLGQLSDTLIDLYPELGMGCTFVDFVDKIVEDGLIPVALAAKVSGHDDFTAAVRRLERNMSGITSIANNSSTSNDSGSSISSSRSNISSSNATESKPQGSLQGTRPGLPKASSHQLSLSTTSSRSAEFMNNVFSPKTSSSTKPNHLTPHRSPLTAPETPHSGTNYSQRSFTPPVSAAALVGDDIAVQQERQKPHVSEVVTPRSSVASSNSLKSRTKLIGRAAVQAVLREHAGILDQLEVKLAQSASIKDWLIELDVCPRRLDLARAEVAWEISEGSFENFVCYLAWTSESVMDRSNGNVRSGGLARDEQVSELIMELEAAMILITLSVSAAQDRSKENVQAQRAALHPASKPKEEFRENPFQVAPLLLKAFVAGCVGEDEFWTPARWYGFVRRYTSPKLKWIELGSILSAISETSSTDGRISFQGFRESMTELAARSVEISLPHNLEQLELDFFSLDVDLLSRIACLSGAQNDLFSPSKMPRAFEQYMDNWMKNVNALVKYVQATKSDKLPYQTETSPFRMINLLDHYGLLSYSHDKARESPVVSGDDDDDDFEARRQSCMRAWLACIASILQFFRNAPEPSTDPKEHDSWSNAILAAADVSPSQLVSMLEELWPVTSNEVAVEMICVLLSTLNPSIASRQRLDALVLLSPYDLDDSTLFPREAFARCAASNPAVLERLERSLFPVTSVAQLQELDPDLHEEYCSIYPRNASTHVHRLSLVEAVFSIAEKMQRSPSEVVLLLFSKPIYLSRSKVYEYLFRPEVVQEMQEAQPMLVHVFKRFAHVDDDSGNDDISHSDGETHDNDRKKPKGRLSRKAFQACIGTMNLSIGFTRSAHETHLVELLRNTSTLDRIYSSAVDETDTMDFPRFTESLGRISLALEAAIGQHAPHRIPGSPSREIQVDQSLKCLLNSIRASVGPARD